jgi:hypothetical protein
MTTDMLVREDDRASFPEGENSPCPIISYRQLVIENKW